MGSFKSFINEFFKKEDPSSKDVSMELGKETTSDFITISLLNRLISAGADKEFVKAVSAIWFLQASNDPNTPEADKIIGGILGTLEHFLLEEARAVDSGVFQYFTTIINNSEYGALIEEAQPIYTAGRKAVHENFTPGTIQVMAIFSHYANVMLKTTKQNKKELLETLQSLGSHLEHLCKLADNAEKNFLS